MIFELMYSCVCCAIAKNVCGDPGNACAYGLHWILWVVCTSATACGLFDCWGDIVTI